MDQRDIDEIVERVIRAHPGCTKTIICNRVSIRFRASSNRDIRHFVKRQRMIDRSLQRRIFVNKGRPNKHAWFMEDYDGQGSN